jgi:cytochrome c-type biogenesis protein CcmE|tara:strand:- start:220 stop:639 length:420 start_codon:yes stop_codon:yes gene_type:complete
MYGRKVKLRFFFVILIFLTLILSVSLVLKSLEENVVYFKSPSDVKLLEEIENKKIRIGGMVKQESIKISNKEVYFIITDLKNEINVTYSGAVPNLFSEGKGVVAEGFLKDRNYFEASKILAKHDENYMPPEVEEALREK